ncbi:MAG: ABC transporter ATP-binding protein [Proteobacteria bacterium]|nr:ABC transporter ATP-binding protein [Pseudomonadota bacterium]
MIKNLISVSNLNKTFKSSSSKALDNISFSVKAGEFFCLLGPDAAGKTTLQRILASVLGFDSGEIEILNKKIPLQISEIQHLIGYMPQKFGLYEDLSVIENLDLNADLRGIFGAEKKQQIEFLLEKTNLKNFSNRLAGRLSGGMKQKLALSCTLVAKPQILLLDEVSVGVDPISRQDLISIVKDLSNTGTAVVWSTTYLDEAEQHADKMLLINEGKQVFFGNPQDFISRTQGRNFLLSAKDSNSNRRDNLNKILHLEGLNDAVLQGSQIRVLNDNSDSRKFEKDFFVKKISATIEDSFLEVLKVKLPEFSKLANRYKKDHSVEKIVIEAQNLTKKFGDFAATDNVNFQIKSGKIFGFLGPNGAGKSTTFKMLCGLLKPTSGIAHVSGISLLTSANEARQKIGYMAQKFSLYGELSVKQNLNFFCGVYGLKNSAAKIAITEIIESLDLENFININSAQLPLGIKQRLALGCALLHKPEVLFLDEPTSGVDPATRREFWFHINALAAKGVTVMVTTHFMDEAEYCDLVAIIYKGLKIAENDPQKLKDSIKSAALPNPSFQDVFASLIKNHDAKEKL